MAEIATFTCSNQECRLTLRLSKDFPVWHNDTPTELRKQHSNPAAQEFITRYRSETFCTNCNKVVEHTPENTCAVCTSAVTTDNNGRECPRCTIGSFAMPHLSVF